MHDATKTLLGTTESSDRVASCETGNPATFVAGLAVRKASTGSLSLTSGQLIGVSIGPSLSDISKTAVVRAGNLVPLKLAPYLVKAQLTFISKVDAPITIVFVAGATAGSEVASVTGDASAGYAISLSMDNVTTKSTATQCKTALDANADVLALIETQIASGQGATEQSAFTVDAIDTLDHAVIGAAVRVSLLTGRAIPTVGALTGAFYASGAKTGVNPDGTTCSVATIDMAGGL